MLFLVKNTMQADETLDEDRQKANAFLRERYLYLISSICGKKNCKINVFEKRELTGDIKAFDLHCEHVIVENLTTPLPQHLKSAVLRTSDILTISFE